MALAMQALGLPAHVKAKLVSPSWLNEEDTSFFSKYVLTLQQLYEAGVQVIPILLPTKLPYAACHDLTRVPG